MAMPKPEDEGTAISHSRERTHAKERQNLGDLKEHQIHGTHAEVSTGRAKKWLGLYYKGPEGQVKIFDLSSQEQSSS